MENQKRKRVCVNLQQKLDVLQRLDSGESVFKLAKELGVGVTTVKDWKKNRKDLESFSMTVETDDALKNRKMLKKPKLELVDEALWVWFCQERRKGTPLSGPIVKEKAVKLYEKLGGTLDKFNASEGWLHRWKKRHGIRHVIIAGEKLSADADAAKDFVTKFEQFVTEHNLVADQIYNVDETGLNYKMLPKTTLAAKNELVLGTKLAKDRLTIATCSNASGNHKMPLFVIGKSKNPRAFKNLNRATLPVYYRNQSSAWMDSQLFKEWFFDAFVPAVKQHLKSKKLPTRAILLLDNAPSHPSECELKKGNIKAMFLPPLVTPLIQPMDQGVIEWLKRRYRRKYVGSLLDKTEEGFDLFQAMKTLNIKDVIYTVAAAWDEISQSTLQKAWKKVWPSLKHNVNDEDEDDQEPTSSTAASSDDPETEEAVVTDLAETLHDLKELQRDVNVQMRDVEEWLVEADVAEVTNEDLTDEQILGIVQTNAPTEDSDDEENIINDKVSHSAAKEAFEVALSYIEQHPTATPMDVLWAKKWRDTSAKSRMTKLKQQTIHDFFK